MVKISIHCEGCNKKRNVDRTPEIPDDVTSLKCNWCPECEHTATDYFYEWYCYDFIPEPENPNQIKLEL